MHGLRCSLLSLLLFVAGCPRSVGVLSTDQERCAGGLCPRGQSCCLLSNRCFDPITQTCSAADDGGTSSDDAEGGSVAIPAPLHDGGCRSNSDCPQGEYCGAGGGFYRGSGSYCLGVGICLPRSNCDTGLEPVCGCDGQSTTDMEACSSGVRIAARGECGVGIPWLADSGAPRAYDIGCANDAQCPSSQRCCLFLGRCFDPVACPTCCSLDPEDTRGPCMTDFECAPGFYCKHDGCDGPGGCVRVGQLSCNGAIEPVCACDGRSFTNACSAQNAGVNIRSTGMCP